jgi:membrane-bound metal-dependent hydrolase YbcI (DUF457 family)
MFIGHYSVALALKKGEPTASLGFLFLAVQLADILFFPLVLLGIERASIIPDLTEASDLRLDFAPFTHSLLGALVAGAIAFLVFRKIPFGKGANSNKLGLVMGLAVFSHWALDVILGARCDCAHSRYGSPRRRAAQDWLWAVAQRACHIRC